MGGFVCRESVGAGVWQAGMLPRPDYILPFQGNALSTHPLYYKIGMS